MTRENIRRRRRQRQRRGEGGESSSKLHYFRQLGAERRGRNGQAPRPAASMLREPAPARRGAQPHHTRTHLVRSIRRRDAQPDKDQMRAPLRRRRRRHRGREIAAAADALETVGGGEDIQDMGAGVPGDPRARCDITQSPQLPSSVGSGRSASNSDTDSGGELALQSASPAVPSQSSGFTMRCCAAVAVIMVGCVWNMARSEDRGGPNGPMSSREYTVGGHGKEVVCYWGTWANYRPGNGKFTPEDIDPSLCTNVIYSFAGLDSETNSIKSLGRQAWSAASVVRVGQIFSSRSNQAHPIGNEQRHGETNFSCT